MVKKALTVFFTIILLTDCTSRAVLAPVAEAKSYWQKNNYPQTYTVRYGDTLYAIAFDYNMDYKKIASYNNIYKPYRLKLGQKLKIPMRKLIQRPNHKNITQKKLFIPITTNLKSNVNLQRLRSNKNKQWIWPAQGQIVTNFLPEQGKKGINIAGKKGQMIQAAASGVVAYAGNGLLGYGNLIILKHDEKFLTAYGNNRRNLVREGQKVKAGQFIAEMGIIDKKIWGVHFEIRKNGIPINPITYLPFNKIH